MKNKNPIILKGLPVSKGIAIGDLSKENNAKTVVKKCVSILGGLDVLICNAGESKSSKPAMCC